MEVIIEAVYENGVLKPKKRLNIPKGSNVTLKILPKSIGENLWDSQNGEEDRRNNRGDGE